MGEGPRDSRFLYVNVVYSDDPPVFCQHSSFSDAPECKGGRCVSMIPPVGRIAPYSHTSSSPVYYYQQEEGVCWKSNGTGLYNWEKVTNSMIRPVTSPEGTKTIIDNIYISEGGIGDVEQKIVLTNLMITPLTGDDDLINESNINFKFPRNEQERSFNENSFSGNELVIDQDYIDGEIVRSDRHELIIEIDPVFGKVGKARVKINFC